MCWCIWIIFFMELNVFRSFQPFLSRQCTVDSRQSLLQLSHEQRLLSKILCLHGWIQHCNFPDFFYLLCFVRGGLGLYPLYFVLAFFCIIYNGQIPPVSYKIIVRSVAYDFLLVLHAHKERETLSHLNCNFCTGSARPHTHIDIVDSKHTLPAMCVSIFHQPLSPPDSMQLHSLLHITITDNTFGHLADIITNQGW